MTCIANLAARALILVEKVNAGLRGKGDEGRRGQSWSFYRSPLLGFGVQRCRHECSLD
ncbi:hypothetical protein K445DRAFT_125720 [Daldinia sp. EC12]|nr:hypothetical protein K445DRAFT_125720 [Daldinia sp. EC12]